MKLIPIILTLISPICLLAQNYQTINSADIHFFSNHDSSYFLATRIDSIVMNGNDSVFFSFKTIRSVDTSTTCQTQLQDAWIGKQIIISSNGRNTFINGNSDSIHIETQANVGDTFLIYTYPNNNWIKGTVIHRDTLSFLGLADSIKEIKLLSNESTFPFKDSSFIISKNNGFVKLYAFFSFPNNYPKIEDDTPVNNINSLLTIVGDQHRNIGITNPTYSDYFDMNVGDFVQFHSYCYRNPSPYYYHDYYTHYFDRTVNNIFQLNPDSVVIKFITTHHLSNYYYEDTIWTDTTNLRIGGLQSPLIPFLPEECHDNISSDQSSYIKLYDNCYRSVFDYHLNLYYSNNTNNCYNSMLDGYYYRNYYALGTAIMEFDHVLTLNAGEYELTGTKIDYLNTSQVECGQYYPVGIKENIEDIAKIYPNPANNHINYQISNKEKISIKILTIEGQNIYSLTQQPPIGVIDISSLSKGLYLIKFQTNSGKTSTQKLIIE